MFVAQGISSVNNTNVKDSTSGAVFPPAEARMRSDVTSEIVLVVGSTVCSSFLLLLVTSWDRLQLLIGWDKCFISHETQLKVFSTELVVPFFCRKW